MIITQLRDWTVDDYHQMIAAGILTSNDRVELLQGQVVCIEIADSTLEFDRSQKTLIYAQAGIADYWVLDVVGRQTHVLRQLAPEGYRSQQIVSVGATLAPIAFTIPVVRVDILAIAYPRRVEENRRIPLDEIAHRSF